MKKGMYVVVALIFLLLAGCVNAAPASDDVAALENQAEQLQENLDALQSSTDAVDSSPGQEANDALESTSERQEHALQPPETEEDNGATVHAKTIESYDLADLETAVSNIGDQITITTVTGDSQTDRTVFRDLKNTLEHVEDKIDQAEDSIEADVSSGLLSRDDYRTLDAKLDALEDRLDLLDDQLEFLFGFDD